jgi:hypothetical protein
MQAPPVSPHSERDVQDLDGCLRQYPARMHEPPYASQLLSLKHATSAAALQ